MPAALLLVSYVGWFVLLGGILLLPGLLLRRVVKPMSSIKAPTLILSAAFGAAF